MNVTVKRTDKNYGLALSGKGGSRPERLEARQHHHGIRLFDEVSPVMHADEKGDLLIPHAGTDVGEALLGIHSTVVSMSRASGE